MLAASMNAFLAFVLALPVQPAQPAQLNLAGLVAAYLWESSEEEVTEARRTLDTLPPATLDELRELERILDRGRPDYPSFSGERVVHLLSVSLPDGRDLPVFVLVPEGYDPERAWPVMLAMHGGPTSSAGRATEGAKRMLAVWQEPASKGWILVSPAMTHVVARAPRTEERLPYEILRPEQMEAILAEVGRHYHVDPDRIVSTGISLGSNFSIAYAASRPDRFAAIVPVSTEGDSRERLLRNLINTPTYILEGARDRNIRSIAGPRALAAILKGFGYEIVYREHDDRAHEGFGEAYPEVLAWLAARPRDPFPSEVLRVPHEGIMPLARRVHWIASDTRQGLVRAVASRERNRIDVDVLGARRVEVFLHDALVDLDRDVTIRVNGVVAFRGHVDRSLRFALDQVKALDDPSRPYAASVTVPVTDDAEELARQLGPRRPPGILSFWETYARRDLEDRFPTLGLEGKEEVDDDGAVAVRITSVAPAGPFGPSGLRVDDRLLEVGGEPFVKGRGLEGLRQWLLRELDARLLPYEVIVLRDGERLSLTARLGLTPIAEPR